MKRKSDQPVRYAIYMRCSSDDQSHGDYTTIDAQRDINTEYVAKQGGTLFNGYSDEGKTGTNLKRNGWKALFADAQAGLFDVVVVTYMSRLARGSKYHIAEHLLEECGVTIERASQHFTDDLTGHMSKEMAIFLDEMYSKQVSQWTRTKMGQMVAKGFVCGGTVPFGCRKEPIPGATLLGTDKEPPKRLVPHPDEAPIVLRAYEVFAETRSVVNVQTYLNTVTDRNWSFDNVTYLLRNEVYRGVLVFGEWRNDSAFEAIISAELWEKVRDADESRARRCKQNPKDTYRYYLRGTIHCPHCGCGMTPAAHPGRTASVPYYECIKSFKKQTVGCPVRRVNARTVQDSIFGEIERAAKHPTRMDELIREAVKRLPPQESLPADLSAVTKRLAALDKQIDNITDAVSLGKGQPRSLIQKIEALETERLPVEMKKAELEKAVEATRRKRPDASRICREWSRITELWAGATDDEREEFMQAFVVRVEMDQKEEGTCEVALLPQVPSHRLELTSKMGAGREVIANRFPLLLLDCPLMPPDGMRGLAHTQHFVTQP